VSLAPLHTVLDAEEAEWREDPLPPSSVAQRLHSRYQKWEDVGGIVDAVLPRSGRRMPLAARCGQVSSANYQRSLTCRFDSVFRE
jgi:hypothetical protein